jgi:hypothetical protein
VCSSDLAGSPLTMSVEDLNVYQATFDLTWTDEPDSSRHTNQPDTFQIEVTTPDGRTSQGSGSNVHGSPGTIEVLFERNITKEVQDNKGLKKKTQDPTWTGDWIINVTCTNAGDQTPSVGPGFFRTQADTGNAWTLAVTWTYKGK